MNQYSHKYKKKNAWLLVLSDLLIMKVQIYEIKYKQIGKYHIKLKTNKLMTYEWDIKSWD